MIEKVVPKDCNGPNACFRVRSLPSLDERPSFSSLTDVFVSYVCMRGFRLPDVFILSPEGCSACIVYIRDVVYIVFL